MTKLKDNLKFSNQNKHFESTLKTDVHELIDCFINIVLLSLFVNILKGKCEKVIKYYNVIHFEKLVLIIITGEKVDNPSSLLELFVIDVCDFCEILTLSPYETIERFFLHFENYSLSSFLRRRSLLRTAPSQHNKFFVYQTTYFQILFLIFQYLYSHLLLVKCDILSSTKTTLLQNYIFLNC